MASPLWILCAKNVFCWLGFRCHRFWEREKLHYCTLYFSLIIVKSLQFRECKQITEPLKYCLVRVIVFLWHVFSLFVCFSQVGNFALIPYRREETFLYNNCVPHRVFPTCLLPFYSLTHVKYSELDNMASPLWALVYVAWGQFKKKIKP